MPRLVLAIWLPLLFTIAMIILSQYCLLLLVLAVFGAGNAFARGKEYFSLVKRDSSQILNPIAVAARKLKPSVGKRTDKPAKRRARRNIPVSSA